MNNKQPHEQNNRGKTVRDGHPSQCTATSKQTGKRCRAFCTPGRRVCRHHGGTKKQGILSPSLKHGKYSKHIKNAGLLDSYQQILQDDDLLSLKDEIAVLSARNSQLFDSLNGRESRGLWKQMKNEYRAFTRETDTKKKEMHLTQILKLIATGGKDFEIWAEISANMEMQRKLSDTERKRIVDAELMITADRAMGLVVALISAFKANVNKYATDMETANRILSATGRDIDALIGENSGINAES